MATNSGTTNSAGAWAMAAAAAAGLADALYGYLVLGSGIDHTQGALLVVCSTALLLVMAVVLAGPRPSPQALRAVLGAGCLLDLLGTGVAAWFLHSWLLLALMAAALFAWIAWRALPSPHPRRPSREAYP